MENDDNNEMHLKITDTMHVVSAVKAIHTMRENGKVNDTKMVSIIYTRARIISDFYFLSVESSTVISIRWLDRWRVRALRMKLVSNIQGIHVAFPNGNWLFVCYHCLRHRRRRRRSDFSSNIYILFSLSLSRY